MRGRPLARRPFPRNNEAMRRAKPPRAAGRGRTCSVLPAVTAAVLAVLLAAGAGGSPAAHAENRFQPGLGAKNVILFIGDGMGPAHVRAAAMYRSGPGGSLSFEAFPFHGSVGTANADGGVTDSAAAATAMATGAKVHNMVVGIASPGDGSLLKTALEIFKAAGRSTGLVTTSYIPDATPAAFGAHRTSRTDFAGIDDDFLVRSRPNVLFGGGKFLGAAVAAGAGYAVVRHRAALLALDTETNDRVAGLFGTENLPYEGDPRGELPRLPDMTAVALRILDNNPKGFFLMVEGGRIDHASHANDIARTIGETIALSDAVAAAVEWAAARSDTLIVVTADHETGGLRLLGTSAAGVLPAVSWSATRHTAAEVPVYALGIGAGHATGARENTDIFRIVVR